MGSAGAPSENVQTTDNRRELETMGENRRKRTALVLLVTLVAVLGFSLAAVPGMTLAGPAHSSGAIPASSSAAPPLAVSHEPLAKVATASVGPAEPLSSEFSIAADPSAFLSTATVEVTVGLAAPSLLSVEQAVNNPASSQYREYLNFAQANGLGASASTASTLTAYLESYGLTVSGDQLSLNLQGTVAQLESALHTTIGAFAESYSGQAWNPVYDHVTGYSTTTHQFTYTAEPRVFYSDTSSIELPASLSTAISGISGLNGLIAQPQLSAPLGSAPGNSPNAVSESSYTPSDPFVSSTSVGGAASINLATGAANYTWASGYFGPGENLQLFFASTMPTLYGALPLWTGAETLNGASDYGQGITIAVIEVGCVDPSVFESFSNATFGYSQQLMGRLTYIALGSTGVGGYSNYDPSTCVEQGIDWGWSPETALDVEYSATMAPHAHIDLLSVPNADFSAFDAAYQFAAQYLIGNQQCSLPSVGPALSTDPGFYPAYTNVAVYGATTDEYGGGACDASLFSNSYGTGEQYILYEGSSMYLTVENELLEAMAAEGATSLFASGDGGGTYAMLNDFMPADSPAVTSVGGGQITAVSGTDQFPSTGISSFLVEQSDYYCEDGSCYSSQSGFPVTVAPVTGSAYFTYWSGESTGTFDGSVAGGFGQSMSTPQAWWQNGLDTYSVGARIDPTVSGQAAFNMTIWYEQCSSFNYTGFNETSCDGPYLFVYGGTSFATPLMAGDLALVEQQLQVRFGMHDLGDANALLYAAHNAFEAGATSINPYEPMENIGCAAGAPTPDWCPVNSFSWYYYNLSYQTPMDQGQAPWFATLYNPAVPMGWTPGTEYGGSSLWNYLQGLGLPEPGLLDKVIVGQTSTDHALAAEPFYVEMVNPDGSLGPITTLTGGQTYKFEVLTTLAGNLPYSVAAYSGGANNGVYGGGTISNPTLSEKLTFTYTPTWVDPRGAGYEINATTYGYFLVSAATSGYSNYWSFQAFAVAPPVKSLSGEDPPVLCVDDIYGLCETSAAEETMFWAYEQGGWYNIQSPTTVVTMNGLPVESAVVIQTSVYTDFCTPRTDCTMSPSYYAPGQTIGEYLTDARGTVFPWMNAWPAEDNGLVVPEVYTLTAYVDGMASNTVTVWVEPQSGSFYLNDLHLGENGLITGTVYLNEMTNLNWANISLVPAPGVPLASDQYVNESFVGVNNVAMSVSLNTSELPAGTPAVVTATAEGWNSLNITEEECFFGTCIYYNLTDEQNPIYWQDPTVFLPGTVSASASGTVTGVDTISWHGTAFPGAVGTLSLVSGSGSTVLATGVSGTYALDTATLADGSYSVVFTESAPGAVTTVRTVSFYSGNEAAAAEATIASLTATISTLKAGIASLQASLAAANASIASLESQVAALDGQVSTLKAQVASLQTQIAALQADNAANSGEVTSLQAQLATANAALSTDVAQIATLNAQVQQLQQQLNEKKSSAAPAWYDTSLGGGLVLLFAGLGALVGVGATYAVMRSRKPTSSTARGTRVEASPSSTGPSSFPRAVESGVGRMPESAVLRPVSVGVPASDEMTRRMGDLPGARDPPEGSESFYR